MGTGAPAKSREGVQPLGRVAKITSKRKYFIGINAYAAFGIITSHHTQEVCYVMGYPRAHCNCQFFFFAYYSLTDVTLKSDANGGVMKNIRQEY